MEEVKFSAKKVRYLDGNLYGENFDDYINIYI